MTSVIHLPKEQVSWSVILSGVYQQQYLPFVPMVLANLTGMKYVLYGSGKG